MSRNRYLKVKSYLDFQDNSLIDQNNRDWGFKICPLINMINESFQQGGIFHKHLSVDEMIVRYYGHNGLKQFVLGKPIRFGYKFWALCAANGYWSSIFIWEKNQSMTVETIWPLVQESSWTCCAGSHHRCNVPKQLHCLLWTTWKQEGELPVGEHTNFQKKRSRKLRFSIRL